MCGGILLSKNDAIEVYERLPKLDCGLCGNPRCMTLARNILSDIQKPIACPLLSQEHLVDIDKIASEQDIARKYPHPNQDSDTIEITPCTEEGMVTLEAQLKSRIMKRDLFSDFFDQFQLCDSLNEVEFFDKMNCSAKMGYALGEYKGKRAHVFKTGKIIMRRADDRQDALTTLAKISRLLLPARLCSCNNTLVDCFGGSCEGCISGSCAALVDALDVSKDYHKEKLTVGDVLNELDAADHKVLIDNFRLLSDFVSEIKSMHGDLTKGRPENTTEIKERTDQIAKRLRRNSMAHVLAESDIKKTAIALAQYGVVGDLLRARDALLNLKEDSIDEHYERAMEILFDAYSAFEKRNTKEVKEIKRRFEEFESEYKQETLPWEFFKVAANGFYISRVLGKPVPH